MQKLIFVWWMPWAGYSHQAFWISGHDGGGQAAKYRLIGQLPAISRPMYETLLTGVAVFRHGVTSNNTCRRSRFPNLFSITKQAGLVNACAGYDWLLELYGDLVLPFDLFRDRYCLEGSGDIMHGIFYSEDEYRIPICLQMASFSGKPIGWIFDDPSHGRGRYGA